VVSHLCMRPSLLEVHHGAALAAVNMQHMQQLTLARSAVNAAACATLERRPCTPSPSAQRCGTAAQLQKASTRNWPPAPSSGGSRVALAGLQAEEQEVEVDGRLRRQQRDKRAQARRILRAQRGQHAAHLSHLRGDRVGAWVEDRMKADRAPGP